MRKVFLFLLCCALPAVAAADDADVPVFIAACPACDCNNDNNNKDSYAGVRLYLNEHATYSFTPLGESAIKYVKNNVGFGTTMGNKLTDYLRVEYETLYMGAQYSASDTDFEYDIWANMLNVYLSWTFDRVITPYVGGGVGLTGIWGEINGRLDNAFDFSYQVLGGVTFALNDYIELEVGFKYIWFGTVEHSSGTSRVNAAQVYIGGAYTFGL